MEAIHSESQDAGQSPRVPVVLEAAKESVKQKRGNR